MQAKANGLDESYMRTADGMGKKSGQKVNDGQHERSLPTHAQFEFCGKSAKGLGRSRVVAGSTVACTRSRRETINHRTTPWRPELERGTTPKVMAKVILAGGSLRQGLLRLAASLFTVRFQTEIGRLFPLDFVILPMFNNNFRKLN